MRDLRTFPDYGSMAQAAAEFIEAVAVCAITERGIFHWVLAGGSTPIGVYQSLAEKPIRDRIAWEKVHLWWGDERIVPPTHADSNFRMAEENLIRHVSIPSKNIHRMLGELTVEEAARVYEKELKDHFGEKLPRFDLILLGMGEDGHTASLFPGTKAVEERERWAVENYVDRLLAWRITLTLPVIHSSRQVLILVSGENKVAILRQIWTEEDETRERLPIERVEEGEARVVWMVS